MRAKTKRTPTAFGALVFMNDTVSPTAIAADADDYTPSGLGSATALRLDASDDVVLTGLGAGSAGRLLPVFNVSTDYTIMLEHQSASSVAANRFVLPNGQRMFVKPGGCVILWYDGASSRWRPLTTTHF